MKKIVKNITRPPLALVSENDYRAVIVCNSFVFLFRKSQKVLFLVLPSFLPLTSCQEASYGQRYPCPALYCFLVIVGL